MTVHSREYRKSLLRTGWCRLHTKINSLENTKKVLERIAQNLGRPVRNKFGTVESIVARRQNLSKPNSLSGKYGLGQFPLHCDTSHWPVPCRYVILASMIDHAISVPTLLLDSRQIDLTAYEWDCAHSAVFSISNGRNSFFSTILSTLRNFIRLDPGCMEATSGDGMCIMDAYSYSRQQSHVNRIYWTQGDILIIDNWRVLHGREGAQIDSVRALLRVLVR